MEWFKVLRVSARRLMNDAGFTAVVVLCLGITIGANTCVFSFLNELFLKPLPVQEPERLARIYTSQANGSPWGAFSYPDYLDYAEDNRAFSGLAIERPTPLSLSVDGRNERIWGAVVSENYFAVLGVSPEIGSAFDGRGHSALLVLSHDLWEERFGGDPGVLGRTVVLNGNPFTVISVAPPDFHGASTGFSPDVWAPVTMQAQLIPGPDLLTSRGNRSFLAIGRLRPGVTLAQAKAPLNALAGELAARNPETNRGLSINVIPASQGNLFPPVRQASLPLVLVLQAMVALVLLLACTNIASLLLSRATSRRQEVAVQLALGATRHRLLGQFLAESLMLAVLGGAAGLTLATWIAGLLRSFRPVADLPVSVQLALDGRVLAFNFAVSLLAGLLFGLAPALHSLKQNLVGAIRDGSQGSSARTRMRSLLVVTQVALSLVLLIIAGLFVRGLQGARSIDPGFDTENIVVASLDVGLQGYSPATGEQLYRQLQERLAAMPQVEAVSLAESPPLNPFNRQTSMTPEGYEQPAGAGPPVVEYNVVTPGYFRTLGIPLVAGRSFTDQDDADAPAAAVVNQELARKFWPGQEAVGRRLRSKGKDWQVVGVVRTAKYTSLAEAPRPYLYLPFYQLYQPAMIVHVRADGPAPGMAQAVHRQVQGLDSNLPITGEQPLTEQLGVALLPARMGALVLSAFGLLALLLAAVGLYGTLAYTVSLRVREIGIRLALGAGSGRVLWLIVGQGLRLAAMGMAAGLLLASLASGLVSSLLYGVSPLDPATFVVVSLFLAGVALVASYIPARRAIRIDPVVALRTG